MTQAKLTVRETEVVRMLAQGMRAVDVARALCRSPKTVSAHIMRVKDRLGIDSHVAWFEYLKNFSKPDADASIGGNDARVI